jgi:hypothetical protein
LRRVAIAVLSTLGVLACRQIIGIEPITYSDAATGSDAGCTLGTPLFTTASVYNNIAVQNGTVFVDVPNSGIFGCGVGGCATAQAVVNIPSSDMYQAFVASSSLLYYTFLGPNTDGGPTGGSVHEVGLDGGNDHPIASNLAFPFWIAVAGNDVFWIDDSQSDQTNVGTTPATVNCIGCNGNTNSVPWITNLAETFAIIADTSNVWVLVDDGSGMGTDNVIVCSTTAPCLGVDGGAGAKVVINNITAPIAPITNTNQVGSYFAGDGTYAYVVGAASVIRTDSAGTNKPVVPGVANVVAITIDAPTGNLYYATDSTIYRTKADGTGSSTPVVCNQTGITALAVDSTSVYFLTSGPGVTNGAPSVAPK